MSLQDQSDARNDSDLINKFVSACVEISNFIINEATTTPGHYKRKDFALYFRDDVNVTTRIAKHFLNRAISVEKTLTLPAASVTDAEIQAAVSSYMSDPDYLIQITREI